MKSVGRLVSQWALSLHIYLSIGGFLLILLFAVTGLTLNHRDFGLSQPSIKTSTVSFPIDLLLNPSESQITNQLREMLGVRSPVLLYKEFPDEIEVLFAAPGSQTRAVINRQDGMTEIESEMRGLLGRIGDLHKGRDSGRVWFWVIDITAILMTISSITGIVTLASLPARRRAGFVVGAIGAALVLALYLILVP